MIGTLRGRAPAPGRVITDGLDALRTLTAAGANTPRLLAYYPVSRVNPYQELLYKRSWAHDVAPLPVLSLREIDDLVALLDLDYPVALHLHWTSPILAEATTPAEAKERTAAFLDQLDRFRSHGGSLIWSVHNIVPHDCRFPQLEARLQQAIVDRATLVHVLSASTPEAVAPWFTLPPERTVHVPHANYSGAYPDLTTSHQARHDLGIDPDEITYLLFGALRPYKGLAGVLDSFDRVSSTLPGPRRLLVAGEPGTEPEVQVFLHRARADARVTLHEERVAAGFVQTFLRAADVVVLPYDQSLNSGVLMLALSYDRPVIAPAVPGVTEIVDSRVARLFTPGESTSLQDAWLASEDLVGAGASFARQAAGQIAAGYDPAVLSDRFFDALAARV